MTPSDREIVRASFAEVAILPEVAGALFYERLFTLNPDFRTLFKHDMRVQGVKLMSMLDVIVNHLDDPDEILPALREMGERHAGYGVKDADYDAVRDSLLWMLEQVLGEAFTPAVRDAWAVCYEELAQKMTPASPR
jgi:hemoglobin-like flavoprotein